MDCLSTAIVAALQYRSFSKLRSSLRRHTSLILETSRCRYLSFLNPPSPQG